MDIFTTQLTRIVPVPIKPENLKVKALLKEAAIGKLKEDSEHLENHDYVVSSDENTEDKNASEHNNQHKHARSESQEKDESIIKKDKDNNPHLDIFV